MTIHALKTHPPHFADVLAGLKRAELRKDDRGFAIGDLLVLQEYEPRSPRSGYTGRAVTVRVTHVLAGFEGLAPEWVMLSIEMEPKP